MYTDPEVRATDPGKAAISYFISTTPFRTLRHKLDRSHEEI